MRSKRFEKAFFGALLALGLLPCLVRAQETASVQEVDIQGKRDAEWSSYRRAYGAAAFFERFTRTRPLIQAQMQVRPIAPDASLAGLRLTIEGKATHLDIAVDAIGR